MDDAVRGQSNWESPEPHSTQRRCVDQHHCHLSWWKPCGSSSSHLMNKYSTLPSLMPASIREQVLLSPFNYRLQFRDRNMQVLKRRLGCSNSFVDLLMPCTSGLSQSGVYRQQLTSLHRQITVLSEGLSQDWAESPWHFHLLLETHEAVDSAVSGMWKWRGPGILVFKYFRMYLNLNRAHRHKIQLQCCCSLHLSSDFKPWAK